MGIYQIKKGTISCDKCKKRLASFKGSREILENLTRHPLEIICTDCQPIPENADYVEKGEV